MFILRALTSLLVVVAVIGRRLDRLEKDVRALDLKLSGYVIDVNSLKNDVAAINDKLDMLIEMRNNTDAISASYDIASQSEEEERQGGILSLSEMATTIDMELTRVKRAFYNEKSGLHSQHQANEKTFQKYAQSLNETLASLDGKFENELVATSKAVNESVYEVLNNVSETVHQNLDRLNDSVHATLEFIELNEDINSNMTNSKLAMFDARISQWNTSIHETVKNVMDVLNEQINKTSDKGTIVNDINAEFKKIANDIKSTIKGIDVSSVVSTLSKTLTRFKEQVTNRLSQLDSTASVNVKSSVRLANAQYTQSSAKGRLEVFMNNNWGTVCDDTFCVNAAKVACKMFGYDKGEVKGSAHFGSGSGPIFMDDIHCTGSESSLFSCPYGRKHNCGHSEDVGVICTYY